MRISDRLVIADKIGRALQSRYSYSEIDEYLAAFGLTGPENFSINSKWAYSKAALSKATLETLVAIAEDLDIEHSGQLTGQTPPRNWHETKHFDYS